ncbi:NAD(P)-binding domain-containing protein [Nocardioides marinus]|uniref:Thioredoxin reductase n=1 Tax=Nocardioides marinus TaxID=374514 RepID=A0A7Z0C181_9ACTN|nr:NAD(P)-binding domain-containing protein [Nocardioides marinus]NYI09520.1 thioredoxin reductase [Nocardioides marinus]
MTLTPTPGQPLVIVGAGPIGLAAAAHAVKRGLPVTVLESGAHVGAAVRGWGHVRLFSPWSELVDDAAARLLEAGGWERPLAHEAPTGREWVAHYLEPLAAALVDRGVVLRTGSEVVGLARRGRDRLVAQQREDVPFAVHVRTADGAEQVLSAAAVIDASGTWGDPGPVGADGWPAPGENAAAVTYRVPDLTDPQVRAAHAGRRVAVVGAGASAHQAVVDLAALAQEEPGTRITWLLRRHDADAVFGGEEADELPGRGALGSRARAAAESAYVEVVTGFRTAVVEAGRDGTVLVAEDGRRVTVDRVVAVTGFRPDHAWLAQVRLDLDGELSAPRALAPEIHPAFHSCGTVSPHGADVLRQPEGGLYLVGMKSYGRAPSFLAMTGFEQVRSVVAEVAGDHEAAARVELVLPETGVCGAGATYDGGGCCGAA